ncbi:MAG: hypothetical protein RLZZ347_93 [Candidatus Parcubacteria bacterium]
MAKNNTNQVISTHTTLFGSVFAYVSRLVSPVLLFTIALSFFAPFIPTEVSANHTGILTTATIDSDATWTVPAGITQYTLKIWGAGGNGGNGGALGVQGYNGPGGGGGGGAGAYGEKTITVTPATATVTASIAQDNTATTTVTVGGMVLKLGPGGNGGVGLEYSGGSKKHGIAYGGPGGIGGIVDPASASLFDISQNGANGGDGTPGGYANSMSGYGFPGAGGKGADGYSSLASGGIGGADPSGDQSYSYGNNPGVVGNGFGGGGGGGSGYGGQGALGAHGRLVVEYSTPIPDPVVPPTISCSATAGVLDVAPAGVNTILSWSTNTPTTTILEVSSDLITWLAYPAISTTVGGCYTVTASTTNSLAQANSFRLTATTTVPVVPPTPPVTPSVSCSATAGILSNVPQDALNTVLSWSTNTPASTVLQSSTDFVNWTTSPVTPTVSGGCYSVVASTTSSGGLTNLFRLNAPVVVPPAPVPVTLKDLTLVGPLTDATVPLSTNTQQVSFTLPAVTDVFVVAYANATIPNSVASTITLSLDGTAVDSAVISDAANTGGGTASVATLTAHNSALSAGSHTLTVSFPAPGGMTNGPVKFYVYKLDTAVSQATADMAIVGPIATTTAVTVTNEQKVTFTVPTTSDVIVYGYVNAGIPNSVSAPVKMLLNGVVVDSATISDAAITGGTTRSLFTMVARKTLTAGTYELSTQVPAPGYIQNKAHFYVQYLNPAPTDPSTLSVAGPLVDSAFTTNTQTVSFTLPTASDVAVFSYASVGIPNSVASTITLSLDGTAVDSALISDAAITGGGTYSLASLAVRKMTLSAGTHTASLAFPTSGAFGGAAQFYVYRLQATSTPVVPPVAPTCSVTPGVLSVTPSGANSILTWSTTTPLALVAQSATNLVNWTTITSAHPIVNNCFSVTASTTDATTGLPNNFRLFDTTPIPVIPSATVVTCPATPGVLAITASTTNSILSWASTTPATLVAQSSTDLTNWTVLTFNPPIVNNCFAVTASTTNSGTGLPNFFRLALAPVVPPALPSCPATPGVLAITPSGVDSILTWATTTPIALVAQSATDLINWTTITTNHPVINNCFSVTASTTNATNGLPNNFRLFDTTPVGGGGGGTPTPTLTVGLAISGSTTTAPINNLPFALTLGGTAVGPAFHQIDCTTDGTYEYASTTLLSSFITPGICTYTNPGTYTATAQVGRNGATTTATTVITVLPGVTIGGLSMSLNLTVSPNAGVAPLNNVGFTGSVSGTAVTGVATTTFSFDCLNDGSFEFSSSTVATSITQANVCSYTNPGTYVTRLLVVRNSFMVSATTSVVVSPIPATPPPSGGGNDPVPPSLGGGGPIGLYGTISAPGSIVVTNSGGGGGGAPQPVATGASCSYLTDYLRSDFDNNPTEVAKLQAFLKDTEKMDVSLTNVFDKQTEDAVKAFQVKYSADILTPWGVTEPTGYVYITTLKKINDIHCAGQNGYIAGPTPDFTQYYADYQAGTTTVNTPFGNVNIASTTSATTTRPFDGIIGSATSTVSDTLAVATTTESFFDQGTIIRGQQNVATVLNAMSDIVLYVLNKVDGVIVILILAAMGFYSWVFVKKDGEEAKK